MPYLSLYRKYRSQVFTEIVGQEHITTTLKNALERDRIAHAYLFSGPRGTGKTSTARIFAKCINCEEGPTVTPCNQCNICLSIISDRLFDVVEIDAASNRGIDDIRDLKEKVRVPPAQARKKVYIIDEVHMLTREAFNALLKTLEEPPPHVLFLMATTEPQKLPPTILSRCQRFDFRRLTDNEISGHIRHIADNEKFEIESGAVDMVVRSADGSLRDAISILDQLVSFSSGKVTSDEVNLMFGLVDKSEIATFMHAIFAADAARAFELFQRFFEAGKSFSLFLRLVMEYLRDIYLIRQNLNPPRDTFSDAEKAELKAISSSLDRKIIVALMDEVARIEDRIRWEVYPKIILEILIIKMIDISGGHGGVVEIAPARRVEKQAAAAPAAAPRGDAYEGGAPTRPQAPPPPPPEPEPEPVNIDPDAPPFERLKAAWKNILLDIKKASMPKYFFFADGNPVSVEEGTLTISYHPDHQFKKEQAQDKDSLSLLRSAIEKFYGGQLTVKFIIEKIDGDAPEPEPEPAQAPEPLKKFEPVPAPEPEKPHKAEAEPAAAQAAPAAPAKPKSGAPSLFDDIKNVFPDSVEID